MHLSNLFLTIVTLFLATVFALPSPPPHIDPLSPGSTTRGLTETRSRMYCTQSRQFTIGYGICTFAARISPSNKAHLWLFDSGCSIIGEMTNVEVFSLQENKMGFPDDHIAFDSKLKYVVVTDLKDGKSPMTILYSGKGFGGKKSQCWRDADNWYVCSFEFEC